MTKSDIVASLKAQFVRKNADYGDSAHQSFVRFGPLAYAVRLSDKFNRWESLLSNTAKVNDESLADTIGDTFTYLCMWAAEGMGGNVGAVSVAMDDALIVGIEGCKSFYTYQTVRHCFDVLADSAKAGIGMDRDSIISLAGMVLVCLGDHMGAHEEPDLTKGPFKSCDLILYSSDSDKTFTAYNHDTDKDRQVSLTEHDLLFVSEVFRDKLYAYDFGGEEYEIPASRVGEFRRVKLTPIVE